MSDDMSAVLAYCDDFPLDKFKPGEVLIPEGPEHRPDVHPRRR